MASTAIYIAGACIAALAARVALPILGPKIKGFLGELQVRSTLWKLPRDEYKTLNDLMLRTKSGDTSQIDHVVVSPYGIFVVETKNYKGELIGGEYDAVWYQHIGNRYLERHNLLQQNRGHVKAIEQALRKYPTVPVKPILAISNNCKIAISGQTPSVNFRNLDLAITARSRKKVLSTEQVEDICKELKKLNITDRAERKAHISKIKLRTKQYDVARKAGVSRSQQFHAAEEELLRNTQKITVLPKMNKVPDYSHIFDDIPEQDNSLNSRIQNAEQRATARSSLSSQREFEDRTI